MQTETATKLVALYNIGQALWDDYRLAALNMRGENAPMFRIARGHVILVPSNDVVARFEDDDKSAKQCLERAGFVEIANAKHGQVWIAKPDRFYAVASFGWGVGADLKEAISSLRRQKPKGTVANRAKMKFFRANPNTSMDGLATWSYPQGRPPIAVDINGKELK